MKKTIVIFLSIISFSLKAQIAEIPFKHQNDLIFIKVNVNNETQANTFIFDTGATADLLDSTTAKNLSLKANYKQDVSGAGGTKSYDIILNQTLSLEKNIEIKNTHLVLTDLTKLKDKLEKNFDGIIGYSLLKKYVTKIDYEKQKILLFNKIDEVDTSQFKSIKIELDNGIPIPQFDISIGLTNGETHSGKILFDSGAGLTLLINTPYNQKYKLNQKQESLISENENLHGKSITEDIRIESMNIGGFELNEMMISISHDKNGVSSYENYLGILGGEVISRFNIILDYSTSTLYLKPNNTFNNSFEFPMSGLELIKVDDKIIINKVEKTSTAYNNGIREGDILLSINNDSSENLNKYRELLKNEGEYVHLKFINSKGEIKKIKLKLKRLL